MKLVKLRDDCFVMPSEISEITLNPHSQTITVRLKNGIGYSVCAEYRESVYTTLKRLTASVDEALGGQV